jgi:hypothetical protein
MISARIARRLLTTLLLVILASSVEGVASAYWRGSGSGAGSATTGTTQPVTLSPGTVATALFPGGQANVLLTVSNPNAFPVRIGSFALGTGGIAVDSGHSGCAASALSLTGSSVGWTVPATGSTPGIVAGVLTMGTNAVSACQGAIFTVYVAAGP